MRLFASVCLIFFSLISTLAKAENLCKKIEVDERIKINKSSLKQFEKFGIDREGVFVRLHAIAEIETSGCWAGISENFDGQLISAGVLQWNYGQNSIQPLLKRFKRNMGPLFRGFLQEDMPTFGELVFSKRCLSNRQSGQSHPCADSFLESSDPKGEKVKKQLREELSRLFSHDAMIQVQMDFVVNEFDKAIDIHSRLFGKEDASIKKFVWVLDSVVQRGGVGNINTLVPALNRSKSKNFNERYEYKKMYFQSILIWYAGLILSPDQDGIKCDWRYNIETWVGLFQGNLITDDDLELLILTWIRARTAQGEHGRWQALAFARRAKVALGAGSVAHNSTHRDNFYDCTDPTPDSVNAVLAKIMFE